MSADRTPVPALPAGMRRIIGAGADPGKNELRAKHVTASTAAPIFGVASPFITLAELAAVKLGHKEPAIDESELLLRGQLLQPVGVKLLQREHTDWRVWENQDYLYHEDERWGATIDAHAIDPVRGYGCVEIKVVASPIFRRDWSEGEPPLYYSIQCAMGMMASGAAWGEIAALEVDAYKLVLHEYPVPKHASAEKKMRAAIAEFWAKIDKGEMPAFDFTRDHDLLQIMYPREVPGKSIDLRSDNRIGELVEEFEQLKAAERHIKQAREQNAAEIEAKLGDAEIGICNGATVTWKHVHRDSYVVKPTDYRQLRVKKEKEKETTP
jgi:predicted phage-related endonuclease